ncbi:MAG: hypothetical protein K2G25_05295 [Oscillospiraceae bacterium]|nr:hypothetical protein [Oscillospiraceae bacterium]
MGHRVKSQFTITLPREMAEILDSFGKYHGMNRSAAIAYLLAKGLCHESALTNGFDFDTPYFVEISDDGREVSVKRSECIPRSFTWTYSIGKNKQGEFVSVSSSDFSDDDITEE